MRKPDRFRVEWTPAARTDLLGLVEYLAEENFGAAAEIFQRLERFAASLASFPGRGRIVAELEAVGIHGYRELVVPPWRVVYRIARRRVFVLAVLDSRRNLEDLLLDRFLR